ncbi:MAG: 2-C-methyl-D-erythritol 2,4-cyclodiphosphate synthase [Omnitrophica bacterium]|nr:2-C-methyl-D-erythritol 2,4-cyclodiphosphate synthase [Candidatus Omnitrophota bacterium]
MKDYMVGLGFDIHRFSRKKKPLILGGVKIYNSPGLEAVSDGDVVLHALSDALCGCCLLGDIGDYFPPQAKESKGIDSRKIINFILGKIDGKYEINNIDVTIVAEKPRLISYKKEITSSLRQIFSAPCVNVKVKSKEALNILGGKNSIACLALASVRKR